MTQGQNHYQAQEAWRQARRKAFWGKFRIHLQNKPTTILDFDQVAERFQLITTVERGVQSIPLEKIVGSVGRYQDFVEAFLPKTKAMQARWEGVAALYLDPNRRVPPIEVFQAGDTYFVRDGNHRVSVANQLGLSMIEARVNEFTEPVYGLAECRDLDVALAETERRLFMAKTQLNTLGPEDDFRLTSAGGYDIILGQILYYQYVLSEIDEQDKSVTAAAAAWYDLFYLSTIQVIKETRVMDDFPQRTPADLFVWLTEHHHLLEVTYGTNILMKEAALDLEQRHQTGLPRRVWQQLRRRLIRK
jgi:hypothetical protein